MTDTSSVVSYEEFASRVKLEQVLTDSCSAERMSAEASHGAEIRLEVAIAHAENSIFYRLEAQARLKSDSGKDVGRVEVSVVTRYDIGDGVIPREDVLQEFADREAVTVAFPYAREGIQSLAARIGFAGVLIPFLGSTSELESLLPE
ncbi:hypothetical protein ACFY9Q_15050 [Streptomyces sp. NPDC012389]|uniref:hypothetical protein n=1 Tax=Streptomyces sp. NPDC012389 TaxID=3364830 RepID=UPI0036EDF0B9